MDEDWSTHYPNGSSYLEPKCCPSLLGRASVTIFCEVGLASLVDKRWREILLVLLGAPDGPNKKARAWRALIGPIRDYRGAVVNDTPWMTIGRKRTRSHDVHLHYTQMSESVRPIELLVQCSEHKRMLIFG